MTLDPEIWLEAFEGALDENEDEAYLKYTRELLGNNDITANAIAADPLLLLEIDLHNLNHQQLDVFLRSARYWRWKSRHYYEPVCSQAEFPQVIERQDTALLRSFFVATSKMVLHSDQRSIQMIFALLNSIFLEASQQLRWLLLSCAIPPEVIPYCVEYLPAFSSIVDLLPELLARDTSSKTPSYKFYYADLASWLSTKYASPRFEAFIPHITDILGQTNSFDGCIAALTISIRLCIALPQVCLVVLYPQLVLLGQKARLLATDKEKLALLESRHAQIVALLDSLIPADSDNNFQYSCAI